MIPNCPINRGDIIAAEDIFEGVLDQPADVGLGISVLDGLQGRQGEDQIPEGAQTDEEDLRVVQISTIRPHFFAAMPPSN